MGEYKINSFLACFSIENDKSSSHTQNHAKCTTRKVRHFLFLSFSSAVRRRRTAAAAAAVRWKVCCVNWEKTYVWWWWCADSDRLMAVHARQKEREWVCCGGTVRLVCVCAYDDIWMTGVCALENYLDIWYFLDKEVRSMCWLRWNNFF